MTLALNYALERQNDSIELAVRDGLDPEGSGPQKDYVLPRLHGED